jgi:DNA-binding NtrC family response regulator
MILPPEGISLNEVVKSLENSLIDQALERTGGHRTNAAKILGMNRTTLLMRMKARGLITPDPSKSHPGTHPKRKWKWQDE